MNAPAYDCQRVELGFVAPLFARFHGYGGVGDVATAVYAVIEDGAPVAAYVWNPPAYGAARSVAPEAPHGVLALTRMVAVPRAERRLPHISRPLRRQMRVLLDRGRWPSLVTYSDEGQGHTGHVYRCSGWQRGPRREVPFYEDAAGVRRSAYSAGVTDRRRWRKAGVTVIQRWEHRIAADAAEHMKHAGWTRVPVGGVWASGSPRMAVVHKSEGVQQALGL